MKNCLILLFIFVTIACISAQDESHLYTEVLDAEVFEVDGILFKCKVYTIPDSEVDLKIRISKQIEGKWYLVVREFKGADYYDGLELLDWNLDGRTDIRIKCFAGGSLEGEHFLFLYDDETLTYKNIERYWWFCGSYSQEQRVGENIPYYYSFSSWGCSGGSYESNLFTIEDFKIKPVGYISINYCEFPMDVTIYKLGEVDAKGCAKKCIPVATINADYIDENYGHWRTYVEHYWEKYYSKFITE